jgi:hypothetical protein
MVSVKPGINGCYLRKRGIVVCTAPFLASEPVVGYHIDRCIGHCKHEVVTVKRGRGARKNKKAKKTNRSEQHPLPVEHVQSSLSASDALTFHKKK